MLIVFEITGKTAMILHPTAPGYLTGALAPELSSQSGLAGPGIHGSLRSQVPNWNQSDSAEITDDTGL